MKNAVGNARWLAASLRARLSNDFNRMDKTTAIRNLNSIGAVMRKYGSRWWVEAGTCLGAYREHHIIAHDLDTDVGILEEDFHWDIINDLIADGFILCHVFGARHHGLEIVLRRDGVKTDIFLFYRNGDERWHAAWRNGHRSGKVDDIICLVFPASLVENYTLAQIDGFSFPVPSDTERYLVARYGESWREPDPKWRWDIDPKCIRRNYDV